MWIETERYVELERELELLDRRWRLVEAVNKIQIRYNHTRGASGDRQPITLMELSWALGLPGVGASSTTGLSKWINGTRSVPLKWVKLLERVARGDIWLERYAEGDEVPDRGVPRRCYRARVNPGLMAKALSRAESYGDKDASHLATGMLQLMAEVTGWTLSIHGGPPDPADTIHQQAYIQTDGTVSVITLSPPDGALTLTVYQNEATGLWTLQPHARGDGPTPPRPCASYTAALASAGSLLSQLHNATHTKAQDI